MHLNFAGVLPLLILKFVVQQKCDVASIFSRSEERTLWALHASGSTIVSIASGDSHISVLHHIPLSPVVAPHTQSPRGPDTEGRRRWNCISWTRAGWFTLKVCGYGEDTINRLGVGSKSHTLQRHAGMHQCEIGRSLTSSRVIDSLKS